MRLLSIPRRAVSPVALGVALIACASSDTTPAPLGSSPDSKSASPPATSTPANPPSTDASLPPLRATAVTLADGSVLPLYGVAGGDVQGVAYRLSGTILRAHDPRGGEVWSKDVGAAQTIFGGFDMDGDGWVDVGLVRVRDLAASCGANPLRESWIDLVSGRTGQVFTGVVDPIPDVCWTNLGYGTQQWVARSVIFGDASTRELVLVPQYQTTMNPSSTPYNVGKAFVYRWQDGAPKKIGEVFTPASPSYDAYAAAELEPHGSGTKHYLESHVPNGLITTVDGARRLVFFTSGRVVQYDLATMALLHDYPFLTGQRTDIVGRNYGGLVLDPQDTSRLRLITGTPASTLLAEAERGSMGLDPWAGIERHVTVYDLKANGVQDRFFSYAHDGGDAYQYEGRTAYPARSAIAVPGGKVRTVFDVYAGGHWSAIITAPGATDTAASMRDLYVWDVLDLDGDGRPEILATVTRTNDQPDVPGYYLPRWETTLLSWDEDKLALVPTRTIPGALPKLLAAFSEPGATDAQSSVMRASTALDSTGKLSLVMVDTNKKTTLVPVE